MNAHHLLLIIAVGVARSSVTALNPGIVHLFPSFSTLDGNDLSVSTSLFFSIPDILALMTP